MPKKYSIEVIPAASRAAPIGKYRIDRGAEDCISCGRCVKTCVYGVHTRREDDPRRLAEPLDQHCKGCFRCIQECPRNALTIQYSDKYLRLGDSYWTPEIIAKTWYQAETGKVPVSGAGYGGPFSGQGFDAMWTDMSEIVRPTRDGIHGREYISTAVDIGRKPSALTFDARGSITSTIPTTLTIPLPIILNTLPFGRSERVHDALARAASRLDTLMLVDLEEWLRRAPDAHLVPFISREEQQRLPHDLLQGCPMIELEYTGAVPEIVKAVKSGSPETIISVRLSCGECVRERVEALVSAGAEIIHLHADLTGQASSASGDPCYLKDVIREVHGQLVDLKVRDEMTLVVSGGIALPEHVAKAILCGADITAIDLPLLIALECHDCKDSLNGLSCPIRLEELDVQWGAQRIINLLAAWRNQLLEVLGAMGLREVRRLRGEVGRAIFAEDLQREVFEPLFAQGVT
jgi:ferredoxin